jgi:5-methylcytosine-specific restriction endonuclease McrA
MKLQTLKPRLQTAPNSRIKTLDAKAGATERVRGRAWMTQRQRVALAHNYQCAGCGRVWLSYRDQIDHIVPLEQGGSNDDSNLQPLCSECHETKTTREAQQRARGY